MPTVLHVVVGPIAAVLLLAGVMLLLPLLRRTQSPRRLRERQPNERLGVRISEEIEQIRRRR